MGIKSKEFVSKMNLFGAELNRSRGQLKIVCDACDCVCVTDQRSTHRISHKRNENKGLKRKIAFILTLCKTLDKSKHIDARQEVSFWIHHLLMFVSLNQCFVAYEMQQTLNTHTHIHSVQNDSFRLDVKAVCIYWDDQITVWDLQKRNHMMRANSTVRLQF